MKKPWLVLGLMPDKKYHILCECDDLEAANEILPVVDKKQPYSIMSWVVKRSEYEKNLHGKNYKEPENL